MSSEKSDAVVVRLADFSESSRVVTLFTREFGKLSCLAKGAKRLKNPFEDALDLLSQSRVVFLHKSSESLDLLTEAQLIRRFQPAPRSLSHLYGGYYVAELLKALTEEDDPHPELYDAAVWTLNQLSSEAPLHIPVLKFELTTLDEIGQLPNFETCTICQSLLTGDSASRFWVSQSGLICSRCGSSEYESILIHPGALAILQKLAREDRERTLRISMTPQQRKEIRRLVTSAVSHVLGRRPRTLGLLNF